MSTKVHGVTSRNTVHYLTRQPQTAQFSLYDDENTFEAPCE